ncbi:hypothetical protein FHETE_2323 [Fusarium heterosporum]|uniref:Metallo-beta-lactamase domain-containing protein n=1 Tax=Fusarium heterosporum TaxID=42747 RepID=A0A8H5TS12_FUSHE|nr:hypothetical protein FHETE_2323 [Fusarium heterosporum]
MSNLTGTTILHIVYAGRGDAFYLEYTYVNPQSGQNEHMLVCLDGGPRRVSTGSNDGPYFKYYLAAGREIWQNSFQKHDNSLPFTPTAIINSHPHDDHLDGLIQLMTTQLLTGPFVLPHIQCPGWDEVKAMATELKLQYLIGCTVNKTIGIDLLHPSPDQDLASFFKPSVQDVNPLAQASSLFQAPMIFLDATEPPVIQLPKYVTIDASSENLASILMQTDPDATVGKGCMFFTGDNVGDVIWDYVDGKHFSIYKIQHHGSMRNTQFYRSMATVYESVGTETALYTLMAYIMDQDPNVLHVNPPFPPPKDDIQPFLKKCFNLSWEDIVQYYQLLKTRNSEYLDKCAHGPGTGSDSVRALTWGKTWDTPSEVWTRLVNMIQSSNPSKKAAGGISSFFYQYPDPNPPRRIPLRPWASALLNVTIAKDNFKALLLTSSIIKFFMSFTADSYVISANKTYSHPSAATIAGLAIAVYIRKPGIPVPLYVTDGYSVDITHIDAYIKVFGYDHKDIFDGKHLVIQYLTGHLYMSINGNGGQVVNRDIRGVTATLSSSQDVLQSLAKASENYNSNKIGDRIIATSTGQRYQIVSPMTPAYLTIDQNTGLAKLVATAPTATFTVQNNAQVYASDYEDFTVVQQYPDQLEVNLRFTNSDTLDQVMYFEIGYLNSEREWVRSYVDNSNGTKVERQIDWELSLPPNGTAIPFRLAPVNSTMMMMAMELEPSSNVALARSFVDSSSQGSSVVASQTQLSSYYEAADIQMPSSITVFQALQGLIGVDNLAALSPHFNDEEAIFQLQIDTKSSSVIFQDYGLVVQVISATLIVSAASSGTILIQGKDMSVTGASVKIDWPTSKSISLAISIPGAGTPTIITKTLSTANPNPVNLKKALAAMATESSVISSISAARIVGYLVGDPVGLFKLLSERVPGRLLIAGLLDLSPDFEQSSVYGYYDPTGVAIVKQAQIICDPTASGTWKPSLALDGIDIEVRDIGFLVKNTLLSTQSVAVYGTAVLNVKDKESIQLSLSCDLNSKGAVEATFTLTGTESLETLSGAIGSDGLMKTTVPYFESSLSDLSQISDFALTFTQSSKHTADYMLSKIAASTSFDEWMDFLPSSFPTKDVSQVAVSIEILNPLLSEQRAVGVIVALDLPIDSGNATKQSLDLELSAHPLGAFGCHEYRLSAHGPDSGLTIAEITSAMGVTGVEESLATLGSLISQLMEDFHIVSFSVGIEEADKKETDKTDADKTEANKTYAVADWSLRLTCVAGSVTGDLDGTLQIESSLLECTLRLPTHAVPGIISIDSLSSTTVASLASALNLSSLDSIPVLSSVLSTQLDTAHYTIGYIPTPGEEGKSTLSCLGYSFTLQLDSLSFTDCISVDDLLVSVGWHSENDPYGPGVEQFVFSIKAALLNKSLIAQIIYDSTDSEITFTLTTTDQKNPAQISDLLRDILGSSFAYALEPLIGNLAVHGATLTLSTGKDVNLQYFSVEIVDSADAQFQGLPMTSLSVQYTAEVKAQGSVPAVPESLTLHATITKDKIEVPVVISCTESNTTVSGNVATSTNMTEVSFGLTPIGLTMASLIELFGTSTPSYQAPDECPDFSSIAVKSVDGQLSLQTDPKSGSSSLSLESFQTILETTTQICILKSPAISLESISLCIEYENGTTTGNVFGHLVVSTADIRVFYSKDTAGNDTFIGSLALDEGQTPVAFDTLAATFLSNSDDYTISPVLGAPIEIQLSGFDAKLVKGQSIEVSGAGQATFSPQASGYSLSLSKVGGRITINESSGATACSAFLTGELEFDNWSCLEAVISIGSRQTLLTAELTNSSTSVDFSTLTKSLSVDGTDVTSVSPSGTANMSFNNSAFLSINFDPSLSQILFFGQLEAPLSASGMVLGQWVPSGAASQRRYLVSLGTNDLSQIWSDLKDTVLSNFDLTVAGAQILSGTYTVSSLYQFLSSSEATANSAKLPITDVASPLKILSQNTSIPIGGTIFATIDLAGSSNISQGLRQSWETSTQEPNLSFYAFLSPRNSTTSNESVFMIVLDELYLLGGDLVFTGTSTYIPGEQSFTANGLLTLNLSHANSIDLQMELSVSESVTSFQLHDKTSSSQTLDNPFGDMFNVTLGDIDLSGSITKSTGQSQASANYALSGSVYLGTGNMRSDLEGSIMFNRGKAVLASLDLVPGHAGLSILDVFSEIIQPGNSGSGSWPSAYGELTLDSASIYYALQQIQKGAQIYAAGYHISADVTIFGESFSITADLGDRSGISITGQMLNTLDLHFITFTNPLTDAVSGSTSNKTGPSLTIDTTGNQGTYQVNAGAQLFDLPQINVTLQYKAETFTGILAYSGTTPGVSDPSLTVLYADGKWSLEILQDMQSKIDLAQQICAASEAKPGCCGKIVDLVFDKTVQTKFHFSMGSPSVNGTEFRFEVNCSYDISVDIPDESPLLISDISVGSIPFIVSPIPDSLDALGQLLENLVLKNAVGVGEALLSTTNSVQFGELIGAMAAKNWSRDLLEKLICRKANQKNVQDQAQEEAESDQNGMNSQDNSGEKSVDASNNTTGSTDLASALDFLSQAIDFAQQFLSIVASILGFLSKVLQLFPGNSTLSGYQTAAENRKANVESQLKKAKEFMGQVLNLSTASPGPSSDFVSVDKSGCEVEVNWSAYLPDTPNFNYDNFSQVTWEVKIGLVNDVTDPSLQDLTIPPGTYSTSYSNPSFAFASTVYSFIRAKATSSKGQIFHSADWTSAQPATHAPWLQPIDNVSFQILPTDPYNCLISAVNCPVGSFHIEIVSDDSTSPATLYETDVSLEPAGYILSTVSILDLKDPPSGVTSCIARIKVVSTAPANFHDSAYATSQALAIAEAPENLQVSYSSSSITAVWNQAGSGTNDSDVLLITADGEVDKSVIVKYETAVEGKRQATIAGASIVGGAVIKIAVRAKITSSNVIGLFAFEVYDIPSLPVPSIDATTYYDVTSQILHLFFTYPTPFFSATSVDVYLTTASNTSQIGTGLPTYIGTTGKMMLQVATAVACQTPKVTVSTLDASTSEVGPPSEPWQFPTIPSSPFTSAPLVSFTSDGSVQVEWSWITAMAATAQYVTLSVSGHTLPSMVQSPTTIAIFTMVQANSLLTPGQKVNIQCTPIALGLWGTPLATSFLIPGSDCTPFSISGSPEGTPLAKTSPTLVAPFCTMTSVAAAGIWWGTPKGAIETFQLPDSSRPGTTSQQSTQLASPSTVDGQGSCMASASRNSRDKEVWWITPTGAIDGLRNDGQGWKPPGTGAGQAYPFNVKGTASTTHGGSMSCFAVGSETALCWVNPEGAIGYAKWSNGSGWGTVSQVAPPKTATLNPVVTQLTTQVVSGNPHLFCVGTEGQVIDIFWINFSSKEPGRIFQNVIAQPRSAAPGGGLVSLNMGPKLVLFWTTPQNSIEMAVLNAVSAYGWSIHQYTLTVEGSVLQGTGIAAYLTEANHASVWWIGQFGDLRRIAVDFENLTRDASNDWPVFEELGPGSCKTTRSLVAQRETENRFKVFYVNSDGAVAGLSYGKKQESSTIQT